MTKSILIVEWMVGGGQYLDSDQFDDAGLAGEGRAMLTAIANDFANFGVLPKIPVDARAEPPVLDHEDLFEIQSDEGFRKTLQELGNDVDYILLIAPESDLRLHNLCLSFSTQAQKLISPSAYFIGMATDKSATNKRLGRHGIKTPYGYRVDDWCQKGPLSQFPVPAILKPNCGAGSEGNVVVYDWSSVGEISSPFWRVEKLCEGTAASISVLCGGSGSESCFYFPPTLQLFENGRWVGCEVVQDCRKIDRATRLAQAAIGAFPNVRGYIGIDILFGETEDDDVLIEVNPRLTSSYLKLRQSVSFNVAEKMLAVCAV